MIFALAAILRYCSGLDGEAKRRELNEKGFLKSAIWQLNWGGQ
jgi:hypothetical protein